MSDLKYQSTLHLRHIIAYSRRRMNDYKMRAEAAEAELAKREQELTDPPENKENE